MEATLAKIKGLATVNSEIIQRLSQPQQQRVVAYKYYVEYADQSFKVREEKEERPGTRVFNPLLTSVSPFVADWRGNVDLIRVDDIFNDKIDYDCTCFQDIVRLNEALLGVAKKYELFGESEKAINEVEKFKANFESLHLSLGLVERQVVDTDSELAKYRAEVEELNNILSRLKLNPATVLGPAKPPATWSADTSGFWVVRDSTITKNVMGWHSARLSEAININSVFSVSFRIDQESRYTHFGVVAKDTQLASNWLGELKGFGFASHSSLACVYGIPGMATFTNIGQRGGYATGDTLTLTVDGPAKKLKLSVANKNLEYELDAPGMPAEMWFIVSLKDIGNQVTILK
jgi:hypothetical protein